MNCKDLNIKLCPMCEGGYFAIGMCWVEEYNAHIGRSTALGEWKHIKAEFSRYPNRYFIAAIKAHYPDHIDMMNKMLILL